MRNLTRWAATTLAAAAAVAVITPVTPAGAGDQPTAYWIVAHQDDAVIGMAAAIRQHADAGIHNVVVYATNGQSTAAGPILGLDSTQVAAARIREARAALGILGVYDVIVWPFVDDTTMTITDLKPLIADLAARPNARIKTHSPYEPGINSDHYKVGRAALELWQEGKIADLRFYRANQFQGAALAGDWCYWLTDSEKAYKTAARDEFVRSDPAIGRYGVAGVSVPSIMAHLTDYPECVEVPKGDDR